MDSGPEEVFDRLTRLAARLLGTPHAFMTLLDDERQYLKSRFGFEEEPLPASQSYCQYVVNGRAPFAVENLHTDTRVADPSRLLELGAIAYCGVPLTDADGHTLGSLCAMDDAPHRWAVEDIELLRELATGAIAEIELRLAHRELTAREQSRSEAVRLLDESQASAHVGSWAYDIESHAITWSREQFRLHGLEPSETPPTPGEMLPHIHAHDRRRVAEVLRGLSADPQRFEGDYRVVLPGGEIRTLWTSAERLPADPAHGWPARLSGTTRDITAERAALAAQHAAEQRHRRLLSNLPDTMVVLYDAALRVVLMQGNLIAELDIDPAAWEGRPVTEMLAGEDREILPGIIERALGGESLSLEYASHGASAGRTFEVEFAPYFNDEGTITGAFTVWRDITARLSREQETRMLATMVQQSEDAILAKDRDGRITAWNGGAERLYGYTSTEAIGQSITLIVPPERRGEERLLLARALEGESSQRDTLRLRKDGTRVNVSISVSPLCDNAGVSIGALVIARDITERIREQEARREIEEQLRVTIEHAPIGVALVDLAEGPHGQLLSVNGAFAELLADPDPALSGLALTSIVHPDDLASLRSALSLLASDDHARVEIEVRCLHPDGRIVWLLLSGAAVPSRDGGAPHLAVVHALDIGERKRVEGQLQHLADHDPLTGLYNRRRFEQELTRVVAATARYGYQNALLMIDLDGFKAVNDTLGHLYGDELISRVGAALRDCLRETDVVGRLGGDEFAVIAAEAGTEEAELIAEKILAAVREHGVVVSEHRHAGVTASVGVALFDHSADLDGEALLARADQAMYAAKQAGRNRVEFAALEAGPDRSATAGAWLPRLRAAFEEDRFELYAQPIRGICSDAIDRFELLLRLRGEAGEILTPGSFLYNAERFDLVQDIDRWVFGRAVALLAAHAEAGVELGLSVNLSGKTLGEATLLDDLGSMISACPVPDGSLVVEFTETAAIVNVDRAREIARALRTMGCRVALDDFGAGFASFYYLKHLDFDYVKIDGEFVQGLASNATDQLVVRSVVDLARGLHAETIAEFVGDDESVRRLRELGVDYGQGYHLGRPAPIADLLPVAVPPGAPPRVREVSRRRAGAPR